MGLREAPILDENVWDGGRVGQWASSSSVSAAYMNGPLFPKSLLLDDVTHSEEEIELGLPPGGTMYPFEESNGEVVYERYLPNVYPSSMPMTHLYDGEQYIAFTAATITLGEKATSALHAFALPN